MPRTRKPIVYSKPFSESLAELNREVAKIQKKGFKKYFTRYDLEFIYQQWKGKCAICGISLKDKGRDKVSAHFTLYVPFRQGGKAERDNLIPVCVNCLSDYSPGLRAKTAVEGYNTLAELIVDLTKAVVEGKTEDEIRVIKTDLNISMSEFVKSLNYLPNLSVRKRPKPLIIENKNTIADLVVQTANGEDLKEEVQKVLDTISTARKYVILREPRED